jgi:hypothetical protein
VKRISLLTAGLLLLSGCGSAAPAVVVRVDGQAVTAGQALAAWRLAALVQHRPAPSAVPTSRAAWQPLVDQELVWIWARRHRVPPPSEPAVTRAVRVVASTYGGEKRWREAVAAHGLTVGEVRRLLARQLVLESVMQRVASRVEPPAPSQVTAYWQAHRAAFSVPRQVLARQIVVGTRRQAEMLLSQIRHGANFAALARRDSRDRTNAQAGGSLGWVVLTPGSDAASALTRVLARLHPGAYGIAHTGVGYHIVEVQAARPSRPVPLSKVAGTIRTLLTTARQNAAFQQFVKRLRSSAKVTWSSGA